ncbi:MAG: imidazole glycerol phosphate synthase subunit HisH [Bdellovibrionota bacterium]
MITVVDYKMINLGSILNMLKKVGAKDVVVATTAEDLQNAKKIILPGVGSFDAAMKNIQGQGLMEILRVKAMEEKVPFLGVCLGMQLMTKSSEEGILPGLGYVPAVVKKFRFSESNLRVPHMGWNKTSIEKPTKLFLNNDPKRFYFVHSYFVECEQTSDILTSTEHGHKFVSGFEHENLIGVQFHPEKSHSYGLELFRNYVEKY